MYGNKNRRRGSRPQQRSRQQEDTKQASSVAKSLDTDDKTSNPSTGALATLSPGQSKVEEKKAVVFTPATDGGGMASVNNLRVERSTDVMRIVKGQFKPPKRPRFGTKGRPIKLRANFFKIKLPDGDLHHYDIALSPTCARPICREVIKNLVDQYAKVFGDEKPVFDGWKNMYSRHPIAGIGTSKVDFVVKFTSDHWKERDFKVSIKHVARVSIMALEEALLGKDSMPYDTIQALDVVMRHEPSYRYVPVGRSFFSPPNPQRGDNYLGNGREIWFGFHQSLRPSQWKMLMNVDVSATAFYKHQKVLSFLEEVVGENCFRTRQPLSDVDRGRFRKEIKGLKVEVTHLGKQRRRYKVTDVTILPAAKQKFPFQEDGKVVGEMTVKDYFMTQYKMALEFPHFPCLQAGDKAKHIYLPLEVCNIAGGQRCTKKLSEQQTATMIKKTATDARAREREINSLVKEANFSNDAHVRSFGIKVEQSMVTLKGRVLDPPDVLYRRKGNRQEECTVSPKDGKWDMRSAGFFSGIDINSWSLVACCPTQKLKDYELKEFCDALRQAASATGMTMKVPKVCLYCNTYKMENIEKESRKIMVDFPDTQLIVYIVTPVPKDLYPRIKVVGDHVLGVPTQVIQLKNVQKRIQVTLTNICQKINAKLGGVNNNISFDFRPEILSKPVIFLGADVTHPSPGDDKKPSIAAVVGSLNASASRYCSTVRVQKHRQEIIADLKEMTRDLLMNFYQVTNKKKPEKIIMYRDGVSEGQFQQVLQEELVAIRKACEGLEKGYEPGVTFIVVQKRHHARFFPQDRNDAHGKSFNIPPGTIVEEKICHPTENDFYLCSHAGIQGTSRPSHYHVLWDDNNIDVDELQKLTYLLCHVFVRCTRSVSIPAPAYYAHLVAYRARYHLSDGDKDSTDSDDSQPLSRKESTEASVQTLAPRVKPHKNIISKMYFV